MIANAFYLLAALLFYSMLLYFDLQQYYVKDMVCFIFICANLFLF